MKSGNLHFLGTFGLVQACNGADLSFLLSNERVIEGKIKMTRRRGGIRKQLLDDVKEIENTGS